MTAVICRRAYYLDPRTRTAFRLRRGGVDIVCTYPRRFRPLRLHRFERRHPGHELGVCAQTRCILIAETTRLVPTRAAGHHDRRPFFYSRHAPVAHRTGGFFCPFCHHLLLPIIAKSFA